MKAADYWNIVKAVISTAWLIVKHGGNLENAQKEATRDLENIQRKALGG